MAAGFTIARQSLEAFRAFVSQHVTDQLQGVEYKPELRLDNVLSVNALTIELAETVSALGPYGTGHAEPRFAIAGAKVIKATVVGEKHISCFIQDTAGGQTVKAIAFRAVDTELGRALLGSGGAPLYLAGHISINTWQGRQNVNFQIVDGAPVYA